jgi:hypothetical protein
MHLDVELSRCVCTSCHLGSCLLTQNSPDYRLRAIDTVRGAAKVTTMARCSATSFWCQGLKVKSGEALTLVDGAWLLVVCHRAGPGEINIQELPDHSALSLDGSLTLVFERARSAGRRGRDVDVAAVAASLAYKARYEYTKRLTACRTDRATMLLLAAAGEPRMQRAIARTARGAVDGVVRELLCDESFSPRAIAALLPFVADPVLVEQLGMSLGAGHRSAMIHRLFELGDDARARHHGDEALRGFADGTSGTNVYDPLVWYALSTYPAHEVSALLAQRLGGDDAATALKVARRYLPNTEYGSGSVQANERVAVEVIIDALSQLTALELHRLGVEVFPVVDEARDTFGIPLGTLSHLAGRRNTSVGASTTSTQDELLVLVSQTRADLHDDTSDVSGWHLRNELLERDIDAALWPTDDAMQWIAAGAQAGMSSRARCGLWNSHERAATVANDTMLDEGFVRRVAMNDPSHHVQRAALVRAKDTAAWSAALDHKAQHWFFAEKAPQELLVARYAAAGSALCSDPRTAEVYLRRGALPIADAMLHADAHVRRTAVRMTRDEELITAALDDLSDTVVLAAALRTLRLDTLEAAKSRITDWSYLEHRETSLRLSELARISFTRADEATARGAINGIVYGDVLWGLHSEGVFRNRVAERLQTLEVVEPF